MKLVLIPRSTLKARTTPRLPGNVLGTSPIVVTAAGLSYTVSLDLPTLIASLSITFQPFDNNLIGVSALPRVNDAAGLVATEAIKRRNADQRSLIEATDARNMASDAKRTAQRALKSDQIALLSQVFS